jgi:hypothetical protein
LESQFTEGGGPLSYKAYLETHSTIASDVAARIAVKHFIDYLETLDQQQAPVSFWTPARQLEFARWCVKTRKHGAGYLERMLNVMRSAFNDARKVKIREDALGNQVETALITHCPDAPWKRMNLAAELKIPASKPPRRALSLDQMAEAIDGIKSEHVFRFVIMNLCTWARPGAVLELIRRRRSTGMPAFSTWRRPTGYRTRSCGRASR